MPAITLYGGGYKNTDNMYNMSLLNEVNGSVYLV